MKAVKIFTIVVVLLVFLPLTVSCNPAFAQEPVDTSVVNTPVSTFKIPEPTATQLPSPTPTITSTPKPTITPTVTKTPTPAYTPTMTPFPTLNYTVEYPFNIEGMTQEEAVYQTLSYFILFISQENEYYESYGIPQNNDLIGFPSLEEIFIPEVWEELSIPAFCRYYPYARLIHDDEKIFERIHKSLDYTFMEAQTLIRVDCSTIDVSMFPPVTR
ncbi:hypothetical protein A2V49_04255 [candidate division WWE3 bacterium RBG_19FT_COMBO_34_6]|uniref:Uncharacterized protein n=1 Tax=candidate division WWE3 bacterium RBG_19FT_COMBO_34_6 TaxID=1802612 RepID=A0A1F4UNB0_UNCKA|nr:MAG: hypothetical protein A2V49_04255 [candidate division WWE3 bacterium RBG_19FT_COMBO_34_6]